ncbi:MAG: hypothetical protein A3H57_03900 [Candidatus Taylorbacteria bacterium RIFCSPLOWO2_02_FULL_43_11]|uniref:PrgI family protein n=1 Tax=Candidatus Taylorbacteria bacterium RIFCSPHIGHO2_02_FULL_43_32b TaxID=1802306 RepID=A0A1G2MJL3_9BACT|nr:MAG: hypothetical protein A2743_01375 [Candidatus Taylorbacteria bacterium RIFCSPHIGHO2_01_FULL_43_47]OHA24057.1 MAG: hypothetical protein A3C72_02890 [Candidatus Taylorbacteria bacterium RIFCSPHIGHO2_02_FULL_43_32b]OHA31479.1 MAG: hypothetical protein A3B08_00855 [Candidatus Taylorbacteria bacterium RIFCSPLOWO2_01_FULL_43_44]OHA37531.1 MAG: hypothetical protein A3H57_03900 [Candidatus Taylorbacteria bacterium RIFCSPLOWO2_02_FULL_43_11]
MRFQVPQFIGVEDKVFGPFTVKQFVYLVGGGAICYLIYRLLPVFLAVIFLTPVAALSIALAFVKINGKPFIFTLEAAIKYFMGTKLYLWKRDKITPKKGAEKTEPADTMVNIAMPSLSESKLKDLTWALDINKSANQRMTTNIDK